MKIMSSVAALLLLGQTGWGQDMLGEFKWKEMKELPKGASLTQVDGRDVLKIENTNDTPLQINLLTITNSKITATVYELTGEVRYDDVKGDGYLEMLNYFPSQKDGLPEGEYFSRTMDESGPMGKIAGTSGWREFTLPFDRTGAAGPPTRLRFNLILKGRGTVYFGPGVKLMQLPKVKSGFGAVYPNAWWEPPTTGTVFGWGGAVIGCLGGLCGWLAAKGKARGFVIAVLWALTGLGAVSGLSCLIALSTGQPFFVWGPMFLLAVLLCSICPVNARHFRRRYEDLELRRMASMDASRA